MSKSLIHVPECDPKNTAEIPLESNVCYVVQIGNKRAECQEELARIVGFRKFGDLLDYGRYAANTCLCPINPHKLAERLDMDLEIVPCEMEYRYTERKAVRRGKK